MKRPFAVIGFSMLAVSLLITNINFKSSVALLIGATVAFCSFIAFKRLRKYKFVIFTSLAVAVYIVSFIFTQSIYINAENKYENQTKISGVVCQTPQETDYAFTYVIKVNNENYKIRYVSDSLPEGLTSPYKISIILSAPLSPGKYVSTISENQFLTVPNPL